MNRRSYSVFEDNLTFLSFEKRFGGKKKNIREPSVCIKSNVNATLDAHFVCHY